MTCPYLSSIFHDGNKEITIDGLVHILNQPGCLACTKLISETFPSNYLVSNFQKISNEVSLMDLQHILKQAVC